MRRTDPHHPHDNCITLFKRLSEYIDRELDAPTCKDIEAVDLCNNLEQRQVPEAFTMKLRGAIADLVKKKSD